MVYVWSELKTYGKPKRDDNRYKNWCHHQHHACMCWRHEQTHTHTHRVKSVTNVHAAVTCQASWPQMSSPCVCNGRSARLQGKLSRWWLCKAPDLEETLLCKYQWWAYHVRRSNCHSPIDGWISNANTMCVTPRHAMSLGPGSRKITWSPKVLEVRKSLILKMRNHYSGIRCDFWFLFDLS